MGEAVVLRRMVIQLGLPGEKGASGGGIKFPQRAHRKCRKAVVGRWSFAIRGSSLVVRQTQRRASTASLRLSLEHALRGAS